MLQAPAALALQLARRRAATSWTAPPCPAGICTLSPSPSGLRAMSSTASSAPICCCATSRVRPQGGHQGRAGPGCRVTRPHRPSWSVSNEGRHLQPCRHPSPTCSQGPLPRRVQRGQRVWRAGDGQAQSVPGRVGGGPAGQRRVGQLLRLRGLPGGLAGRPAPVGRRQAAAARCGTRVTERTA